MSGALISGQIQIFVDVGFDVTRPLTTGRTDEIPALLPRSHFKPLPTPQEHRRRSPETTDELISSRISGDLRFYDGVTHLGLFGTPKWLREAIEKEERIMTVDNPAFML